MLFFTIFVLNEINADLVHIRGFFQKHKEMYRPEMLNF